MPTRDYVLNYRKGLQPVTEIKSDNTRVVKPVVTPKIKRKDGVYLPDGTFVSYQDLEAQQGKLIDKKGKPSKDNRTHYQRNEAIHNPKTLKDYMERTIYDHKNLWDNDKHVVQGLNKTVVPAALTALSFTSLPFSVGSVPGKLRLGSIGNKLRFGSKIYPEIILDGIVSGVTGGLAESFLTDDISKNPENFAKNAAIGGTTGGLLSSIPVAGQFIRGKIPKTKANINLNKDFSSPTSTFTLHHEGKTLSGNDNYSIGLLSSTEKGKGMRSLRDAMQTLPKNTRLYEENLSLDSYNTLLKAKKLDEVKPTYTEHSDFFNYMGRDTKLAERFKEEYKNTGKLSKELATDIVEDINKTLKSLGYKERAKVVYDSYFDNYKINHPLYELKKTTVNKAEYKPSTPFMPTNVLQNYNSRLYLQDSNLEELLDLDVLGNPVAR